MSWKILKQRDSDVNKIASMTRYPHESRTITVHRGFRTGYWNTCIRRINGPTTYVVKETQLCWRFELSCRCGLSQFGIYWIVDMLVKVGRKVCFLTIDGSAVFISSYTSQNDRTSCARVPVSCTSCCRMSGTPFRSCHILHLILADCIMLWNMYIDGNSTSRPASMLTQIYAPIRHH